MDEATFWTRRILPQLKEECQQAGFRSHFERIENLVGDGTPDVSFVIDGVSGRIENKYTPRHPQRATTHVLGRDHGLRRSQVIWNYRHARAGGRCFCLIGTPDAAWLLDLRTFSPLELTGVGILTTPQLDQISAWCAVQGKRRGLVQALLRAR